MGQFSDDCQWWWDGTQWVATSQVVLPQLPATEFERAGQLKVARARRTESRRVFWTFMLALGWDVRTTPVERDYREWTLQQLALATAYLLGPDEPMLAGEVSIGHLVDSFTRRLALAITKQHVLVFRIDFLEGQPRWIALAARAADVKVEARTGLFGLLWPAIQVTARDGRWTIEGHTRVGEFNSKPVLDAWRQAARQTVQA